MPYAITIPQALLEETVKKYGPQVTYYSQFEVSNKTGRPGVAVGLSAPTGMYTWYKPTDMTKFDNKKVTSMKEEAEYAYLPNIDAYLLIIPDGTYQPSKGGNDGQAISMKKQEGSGGKDNHSILPGNGLFANMNGKFQILLATIAGFKLFDDQNKKEKS